MARGARSQLFICIEHSSRKRSQALNTKNARWPDEPILYHYFSNNYQFLAMTLERKIRKGRRTSSSITTFWSSRRRPIHVEQISPAHSLIRFFVHYALASVSIGAYAYLRIVINWFLLDTAKFSLLTHICCVRPYTHWEHWIGWIKAMWETRTHIIVHEPVERSPIFPNE